MTLPTIAGRVPVIARRNAEYVIHEKGKPNNRLFGDGEWYNDWSGLRRNGAICTWLTEAAALAFLRDLAAMEQPQAVTASVAGGDLEGRRTECLREIESYFTLSECEMYAMDEILTKHFR